MAKNIFIAIFIVFLPMLAIYMLTLPNNHNEAEDALLYINKVQNGSFEELFHPSHMLHLPASRIFISLARVIGVDVSVLKLMPL